MGRKPYLTPASFPLGALQVRHISRKVIIISHLQRSRKESNSRDRALALSSNLSHLRCFASRGNKVSPSYGNLSNRLFPRTPSFACSVLAGSQYLINRLHRRRRCCRINLSPPGRAWKALPREDYRAFRQGTAFQAATCLLDIPGTSYPVNDRLFEAVVPSRHTCES